MEPEVDFEQLARDWIRHVRGRRSQRGLSRRLGYESNVLYRWETGRARPSASTVLSLMQRLGMDVRSRIIEFHGGVPSWLDHVDPTSPDGVATHLRELRGETSIIALAARAHRTRYQITRWLRGSTQPRLSEWLMMIQLCSGRVLDLVAVFFGDTSVPSVAQQWRRLVATRQAAYDQPESHLVLRALELEDYQRLAAHRSGFIADRLGLSLEQELACLRLLEAAGQIQLVSGKWQTSGEPMVDTRADQRRSRQLRAFWLRQAADALESGAAGTFGYNLFSISQADLDKARTLHARYFQELQELVRASRPNERIVMFATQLYTLDRVPPRPR